MEDHEIHEDLTKEEIIEVFDNLEEKAREFSQRVSKNPSKKKESFLISIIWIGFTLDPDYGSSKTFIKAKTSHQMEQEKQDGSRNFRFYELTKDG